MDKTKILIVEDEFIIAEDIKRSLLALDYSVVGTAASGAKALELVESQRPDLILMDIMLQDDITGLEVAQKVLKNYDIPVIFLTGYANESILQEASKANPFGYILKPFEDKELHATIKMALYKSKMENRLKENREFLWNVIDTVPDYIFVKDESDRFVMVNKALAGMFDLTPQEMVGKTGEDLAESTGFDSEKLEEVFSTKDENLSKNGQLFQAEQNLSSIGFSDKWVQTTKVPLKSNNQLYSTLGVSVDITNRKKIEMELQASLDKMKRILHQTVQGLVLAVEIRDPYTAGHQKRVAKLAEEIGKRLGMSENSLDGIKIAAIIHDVGKIYVPAEILNKPGKISEVEFNLIKMHPENGYEILKNIEFPWPIADIVYQHHEKLDGTGYPNGLKGDEILLEAQIISIADIVEAMMSHRPYRPALGLEAALKQITSGRGVAYNDEIVGICESLFKDDFFEFE